MKVTTTTKELLDAIKTVEGSLLKGNDKATKNQIISNICIKVRHYYFEMVATDGSSLTMVRINPKCDESWDKDLINKEFLFNIDSIKRVIDKTSKIIELEFNYTDDNNKTLTISYNNFNTTLPSVCGMYPGYEQLMSYNDNYNEIKRDEDETITIGISRKLLLDILKSYDSKDDYILKFEIPKDNYRYIGIRPSGMNNCRKFTMLMPAIIR